MEYVTKVVAIDGSVQEIPFTENEIKHYELRRNELIEQHKATEAERVAKQNARVAVLAKLGLTEEEVKLLLS